MKQTSPHKKREPVKLGLAWLILLLPLLPLVGVAAVLSIPYSRWMRSRARLRERQFEDTMRSQGRTLNWDELEIKRKDQIGCIVAEWLSFKGPTRWWWMDDPIKASGILKVTEKDTFPNLYAPIDKKQWSSDYTGPCGKATLICATKEQKKTVMPSPFRFIEGVNALLVAPFLTDSLSSLESATPPS